VIRSHRLITEVYAQAPGGGFGIASKIGAQNRILQKPVKELLHPFSAHDTHAIRARVSAAPPS
jgi:hypothetical protein